MFFTETKLTRRTADLKEKRYIRHAVVTPFDTMEGKLPEDESNLHLPEFKKEGELNLNDFFIGRDRYLWLEKTVTLPQTVEGCEVIGYFDFGNTGGGNNSGFESMLYVNGREYQGVDTNHKEVFFSGMEGRSVKLNFLLWTGLEGGGPHVEFYHRCQCAEIRYLHKKTDELYYFAWAITETLRYMEQTNELYCALRTALDRALMLIDWDGDFYGTVDAAHDHLLAELGKIEKHTDITVNVIGHTHIDMAWLWRLKHTREKAQRSFSTVLRLMQRYDEYLFLQSQPQLYRYIKEECPELYAQIKQKVAEGKWETDGGMWVEADCNLSSGESLVRQFLNGIRFFEQEFGQKCRYLWLPDVFGYSWALPQILKQCELETFSTTKISWNQYNSMPHDLFKWKGIDGTEILTYFVDIPEVDTDFKDRYSTYNGFITPRTLIGGWTKFKDKDLSREILLSYGFGDGGGGVNRDMLEMGRVLDKLPGVPHVKQNKAGDFFGKIHRNLDGTDQYVHTWDGELYLEYHRGTYTTQGYNKFMNRYLENRMTQVEWLSALSHAQGGEYAETELKKAWETILLHQFHDIIPGSSIGEVYADSRKNYAGAIEKIDRAQAVALEKLVEDARNTFTVYSVNSFAGEELVHIPVTGDGSFADENGNVLKSQRDATGYWVLVNTKPFAGVTVRFCSGEAAREASSFCLEGRELTTPFYKIVWNEAGQITGIYDSIRDRELVRPGAVANALELYEDKPMNFEAWDIDIYYGEKKQTLLPLGLPAVKEQGSLRTVLTWRYRTAESAISQDMIVYAHTGRIDFVTHVDWHESRKLLKAAFYTDIRATKATYDIQFGHVERPTHWNNSWDMAKFEVCGHKWADISESDYGVSLLNNGKYGHSIKDGVMRLSLLRSPKYPDTSADMGEHCFTYALLPHSGSVTQGSTVEEANALNQRAQVIAGRFADDRRIVTVDSAAVQIDAVKKAEDDGAFVVRIHECRGSRTKFTLRSEYPVKKVVPCNLLEHPTGDQILGAEVSGALRPFEIRTYKLYL